MLLRRKVQLGGFLVLLVLSGCGRPKSFDEMTVRQERQVVGTSMRPQSASAWQAGSAAVLHRNLNVLAWSVSYRDEEQPQSSAVEPRPVTLPSSQSNGVTDAPTSIWDCIATAETGGDYTMHGSTYSTAFGVINDIVREYGSPEEQAAIFAGTASKETQIAVVSRFANEHGFGGWGVLTKQKCGL